MKYFQYIATLAFFVTITVSGSHAMSETDPAYAKMTEAQIALAERTNKFMADMDKRYFDRAEAFNGSREIETRDFTTETSDYTIDVTRGPVMEKLGRMLSYVKKDARGDGRMGELVWGRFYSIDAHPKTPLVGMLHATMVVQAYDSGMTFAGGWLGILPGTRMTEDEEELKVVMDNIFEEFGVEVDYYRELICVGDEEEIVREFRRKPACVGASFYGRPPFMQPEKNFDMVTKAFVDFTDKYMDLVEKRKDDPFTEADIKNQDDMRRRWLIDQLYSDPFASAIVPFEVWSFANNPPVIKF